MSTEDFQSRNILFQNLGDNFTPEEMGSIETSLRFKAIRVEQFKLILPPSLPELNAIRRQLNTLADAIYRQGGDRAKVLIK